MKKCLKAYEIIARTTNLLNSAKCAYKKGFVDYLNTLFKIMNYELREY